MKVLVDREDEESVFIRIERSYIGLGFDTMEDTVKERGLQIGCCRTAELTLTIELARELFQCLQAELEEDE